MKHLSDTTKEKIRQTKLNDKNPHWSGDDVGYQGIHIWVRRRKSKPELCEMCNKKQPYDLANLSGEYKRDINDFQWLCRKCHMKSDDRHKKLIEFNKSDKKRNDVSIMAKGRQRDLVTKRFL